MSAGFELVFEIDPPTRPDLGATREQVEVLRGLGGSFLIPDNHLGRATVSSIAVAREIAELGVVPIACVNSRDRNRLGFQRDLLTAAVYGVRRLLFVAGDRPDGADSGADLTVRGMIAETRAFDDLHCASDDDVRFAIGVTSRLAPLPAWKRRADYLLVQATFDLDRLLAWRDEVDFEGPVYAGVLVLASAEMAKRIAEATDEIAMPEQLIQRVTTDRHAGVETAVELIERIQASGAFAGAHVIPVSRYRALATRLERAGFGSLDGGDRR